MSNQNTLAISAYPSHVLNALALFGICISLIVAFYFQIFLGELPCPLCMMQRIGLLMVGFGFFLNVRFGPSALHYAIIIFSAMVGAFASVRQVALHIVPGTGGFGSTVFGLHMYTWGLISFMATVVFVALMLVVDRNRLSERTANAGTWVSRSLGALLLGLGIANVVSDLLVCGFAVCSGDPTGYKLLPW